MPTTKNIDYVFLFVVVTLSAIGMIMVFSASPTMALKTGDTFYYIKRHIFYLLLGACAFYYAFYLNLTKLKELSWIILFVSILLLILVFVPVLGRKVLGAARWVDLGLLSFQPSEIIKFSLVLFSAKWFSENKNVKKSFLVPLFFFLLISVLIIKQPDMGTVVVLGLVILAMIFLAGIPLTYLFGIGLAGVIGVLLLSFLEPYRLRRLLAYLDPWKDPQGIGFQIIQSLLAVGSGGFWGLGLGASRQKFFYLPQQFTDFIFAILCEELGFLGGVGVIVLFAIFTIRGFRTAFSTKDVFTQFLTLGLVSWISIQALINIMVVLGLLPTTGIPLPFISYGGTATIVNLFASGIVLNVSRKRS